MADNFIMVSDTVLLERARVLQAALDKIRTELKERGVAPDADR